MISQLYKYGSYLEDVPELKRYFSHLDNPFEKREDQGKVLVGLIENKKFVRLELEDFDLDQINLYQYKALSGGRSQGIIPTLYVNFSKADQKGKTGLDKTADRLLNNLNKNRKIVEISNIDDLLSKFKAWNFNDNYYYIITLKIDGKYLGEIPEFKNKLADKAYKPFYVQSKGQSLGKDKLCALTSKIGTVYGFSNILGFTVDSTSFIRNGYKIKDSYKMFPVSKEAIPTLLGAKRILLNLNTSHFYGQLQYAVLPNFILEPDDGTYLAKKFLDKSMNIDDGSATSFIKETESILQEIIEDGELAKGDMYYSILFFEQNNAQFKIHLILNDVLPSRISKILEAKQQTEKYYAPLTNYILNGQLKSSYIYLIGFRKYFTLNKQVQPAYFKFISSVFTGSTFNDDKFISLIVKQWRSLFRKYAFKDREYYKFSSAVKNSLPELSFLNKIRLFKPNINMEKSTKQVTADTINFIDEHPAFFTSEYAKGAFLFGCLTSRLFIKQQGNAFMRELNGLNINKELIKKKFPKLIAKLRQYDMEFKILESKALKYFAINDPAKKDEISFAFTMGLVLQKDFDRINKEGKEKENKPKKAENNG